jgi:hypothetical protein
MATEAVVRFEDIPLPHHHRTDEEEEVDLRLATTEDRDRSTGIEVMAVGTIEEEAAAGSGTVRAVRPTKYTVVVVVADGVDIS